MNLLFIVHRGFWIISIFFQVKRNTCLSLYIGLWMFRINFWESISHFFSYVFCRMTLLLGPPSSGKTTLLLALAGKLDPDLKVKIISFQLQFFLGFAILFKLFNLILIKKKKIETFFFSCLAVWLTMDMAWMSLYPRELLPISVNMISILEKWL